MVLNEYFKNIFCINLDKRPDKWEDSLKEFQKIGLSGVTRFSGVDGNPDNLVSKLLPGEVGCILSHLSIIKKAKENNLENILVFEDDVVFHQHFNEMFESTINSVPTDWDMLYFCGNHQGGLRMIKPGIARVFYTFTTNAYAMKSTLYEYFINELSKLQYQVDVVYAQKHKTISIYCFKPHLAWQRSGISDIHNVYCDYHFLKN